MRGEGFGVREERSEPGLDMDPDPWKMFWIRPNDTDPLDPDPQHCSKCLQNRRAIIFLSVVKENTQTVLLYS